MLKIYVKSNIFKAADNFLKVKEWYMQTDKIYH